MNKKLFKYYGILIFFISLFILKNNISSAQIFNPYTGNYTTTGGLQFPSYGQASAAHNQLNYSQQYLEALKLRDSMIQQHGLAEVEKLEREKKAPWSDFVDFSLSKQESSNAVNNHGIFKFDNSINASDVADELFGTPSNIRWKPYFIAHIENYENRTLNSAWKNNLAGAIAFFAQAATKIYHNIEIPPGFRKEEYFNILNNVMNQQPNTASDRDKQISYYVLIGYAGVLLEMELEAKQSNQIKQHQAVRELAGNKIQEYLRLNPENIYFGNNTILVKQGN